MPEENLANRVYYTCLSPGVRKLQLRTPQAPKRLSAPEAKGGVQFWGEDRLLRVWEEEERCFSTAAEPHHPFPGMGARVLLPRGPPSPKKALEPCKQTSVQTLAAANPPSCLVASSSSLLHSPRNLNFGAFSMKVKLLCSVKCGGKFSCLVDK